MKTILATAYAVNPYKGSEDGMGWHFSLQIARFNSVIVVTRKNNAPQIERYMREFPSELYANMQFLYFDLPFYLRFWKKPLGTFGAMLYFLFWQRAVVSFIARKQLTFDITHNLNFHNDWTPSYLWRLGKPFVWGPVGHHPAIPAVFTARLSWQTRLSQTLIGWVKHYFWHYSTDLQATARHAAQILAMHSGVTKVLPHAAHKTTRMPSVATEDTGFELHMPDKFTVVSAGRLVALKGFDLTLHAFALFLAQLTPQQRERCELIIVGEGPENARLYQLAEALNISNYVRRIGWIARPDLLAILGQASAFLFPSHEGAGMVVAEALSFGLPVVCLANEGPGEFINESCGFAVNAHTYEQTVADLADALRKLATNPEKLYRMRLAARQHYLQHFHWHRRGEKLASIYAQL